MTPGGLLSRLGWAAIWVGLLLLAVAGTWLIVTRAPGLWVIGHALLELGY